MITGRDEQILQLIEKVNTLSISQIYNIFFKDLSQGEAIARRRMLKLYKAGNVNRLRSDMNSEYIYYIKKNNQFQHSLLIAEFYSRLTNLGGEILDFEVQKKYGSVIPDAYIKYAAGGKAHLIFAEIQISNVPMDQEKYETYLATKEYKNYFPIFPKVAIITDKKVSLSNSKINYYVFNINMENIKNILGV